MAQRPTCAAPSPCAGARRGILGTPGVLGEQAAPEDGPRSVPRAPTLPVRARGGPALTLQTENGAWGRPATSPRPHSVPAAGFPTLDLVLILSVLSFSVLTFPPHVQKRPNTLESETPSKGGGGCGRQQPWQPDSGTPGHLRLRVTGWG